jgi:diphthamide biosynthesis methyltransferase
MTRLIASYGDSDITDLLSWLADKKIIAIDTETVQEGNSPIKMDLHDSKVVMLQIGDKYDQ